MSDVVLSVGANTDEFKSSIGGLAQDLIGSISSIHPGVAAAVGVIAGIGIAAFNVGKDFETAFNSIRTGTGATGENLEGLKEDFRGVFAGVPEDAATVGTAIGDLNTKLGLSGQPLQELSTQFLNLARINKEDVSGAIDSTSKAFNAWGVESDAQAESLDYLFKVSQSTGVSVTDLSAKTTDAATTGKNLGLSFQETAALIGQLEKTTGDSAGAMGGLSKAVLELTKDGIPAKDALGAIIAEIKATPDGVAAGEQALAIFGKSAADMTEQIKTGKFDLDEMMGAIAASPDTINGVAADVATFGEKFDVLGNKVSLVLEPLGTFLVDGLTAVATFLVDSFNPAMEFMGELWDGLLAFIKPLTDFITGTVIPTLKGFFEVWLGIQLLISDALSPVLLFLWNNILAPLGNFIKDVIVTQFNIFTTAIETLLGWLGKIPGVSDLVKAAQDRVKQAFTDTGTESDTTKGKIETHTTALDNSRAAQDKIGAPGGSGPKLSAAVRDAGKAHDEAKEKVEKYTDAQNLAVAAADRAFQSELALEGQTGALQTAFENVEQPVIDVGGAVTGVDNSVLAVTASMANADVAGSLDKWKTDAETKLPEVKGPFVEWAEGVSSIVGSLSTGLTTKLFTDPGSFGAEALGKLKTIGQSFLDVFDTKLFGPEGVITKFINQGLKALMGALDGLINKITGGVGGALSNVFGSKIPGVTPQVPGVPSVPDVPGGSNPVSGLAGAANPINIVSGVVSAISGVFGNFQMASMNTYLDLIEKEARKIKNILGGDDQASGISLRLGVIEEGVWYGPGVKAVEDFRNKWFDFGLPVFRALEIQGAYVQPTLSDISTHGIWAIDRLDSIIRNTERTAVAVERMGSMGSGLTIDSLKTAFETNEGGLTTTAGRFVRAR
jgi:hypothetical protein